MTSQDSAARKTRLAPEQMYPSGEAQVEARFATLPSGLRVRVVSSGPSTGLPTLLIHGWGACAYTFRFLIPALAASGRRVLAVELRGHGLTNNPEGERRFTTESLLADVVAFMDAERIDRAAVVGHSLGGGLALRLALEHPTRVSDLVLAAPVGLRPIRLVHFARRVSPRVTDRFARWLVPRALVAMLLRGAYGQPTRVRQRDVDEYWAPSQSPDYYRAVRALLHDFDWRPLPDQLLARLSVRSLVIMGTADRLIPDAGAPAMRVQGAARLVIEGAGHLAIEERHEEVNPAIVRFLDGGSVVV